MVFKKGTRKWWVLFTLSLVMILVNIDYTGVNLALANIASTLHVSLSTIQWVVTIYPTIGAAFTIIGGRFGDIFGAKRVFIASIIAFGISSLFSGLAHSGGELILARAFQGLSFGFLIPIGPALIFNTFSEEKRGLAMGIYMSSAALAQSVGPTLGGFLIHYLSWRYIFLINVPVCVIILIAGYISIKRQSRTPEHIDFIGLSILSISIMSVMFAFNQGHAWGVDSFKFLGLMVLGLFGLFAFTSFEKRCRQPLMDLSLFYNKYFVSAIFIRFVAVYGLMAFLFIICLMLQNILGYSPIYSGIILLADTVFMGVSSVVSGQLTNRLGPRRILVAGCALMVIGFGLLFMIGLDVKLGFLLVTFSIIGSGLGCIFSTTAFLAVDVVKEEKRGQASGILYTVVSIGAALGAAVTGFILGAIGSRNFAMAYFKYGIKLTSSQYLAAHKVAVGTGSIRSLRIILGMTKAKRVVPLVQHAFLHGFMISIFVVFVLTALSLLSAAFMLKGYRK